MPGWNNCLNDEVLKSGRSLSDFLAQLKMYDQSHRLSQWNGLPSEYQVSQNLLFAASSNVFFNSEQCRPISIIRIKLLVFSSVEANAILDEFSFTKRDVGLIIAQKLDFYVNYPPKTRCWGEFSLNNSSLGRIVVQKLELRGGRILTEQLDAFINYS